ncbi:MAG: VWA domain-containing protein [Erysipelotrichia bacterium]|nr:VWA domain-containing protein [Erysipelotrichia bacterium]
MKEKITEIVFVIDRSGSMSGLESDTIGGFNGMLKKQKNGKGEAYVTTVLFDDRYEVLHDHLSINKIEEMDENQYYTRGTTALLDAMGLTIKKIENIVKHQKNSNVIMIIITDGYENASKEYSSKKVKQMVSDKKESGWEFIFLGANIDAVETAESLGVDRRKASNYHNDEKGIFTLYQSVAGAISSMREKNVVSEDCLEDVRKDFKERE